MKALLLLALVPAFAAHLLLGPVTIPPGDILPALLGLASPVANEIVVGLRLPRALVALVAGAMLGLAGALLQAVTRNPLAEPGLMGVSGGAVLAIVLSIVGASWVEGQGVIRQTGFTLVLAGVAGGMAAGSLTYALAWRNGSPPVLLVLMGMLIAGTTAALTSIVLLNADENQLRLILHWTIGSTQGRVWVHWGMIWPFAVLGIVAGLASAGLANALQLGDSVAAGLGLRVERARLGLIFVASVLTAGAVSVIGGVGFVGLMAPHLARLVVGQDARRLFPSSLALGGLLLLVADLGARLFPLSWIGAWTRLPIAAPTGLPVGVVTPMLGVPFFLALVVLHRRGRG